MHIPFSKDVERWLSGDGQDLRWIPKRPISDGDSLEKEYAMRIRSSRCFKMVRHLLALLHFVVPPHLGSVSYFVVEWKWNRREGIECAEG